MADPPWKAFRECPDCGHENYLYGCECENKKCICYKKNNDDWNGTETVNTGGIQWKVRGRSQSGRW